MVALVSPEPAVADTESGEFVALEDWSIEQAFAEAGAEAEIPELADEESITDELMPLESETTALPTEVVAAEAAELPTQVMAPIAHDVMYIPVEPDPPEHWSTTYDRIDLGATVTGLVRGGDGIVALGAGTVWRVELR